MANPDDAFRLAEELQPAEQLRLILRLWASWPAQHWAAPTASELAEVSRRLSDLESGRGEEVRWEVVRTIFDLATPVPHVRPRPGVKIYSAPRRFDLFTIFIVTAAYSILLGGLRLTGLHPIGISCVAGFITFVGLGQALFGGTRPRLASVISGVAAYFLCAVVFAMVDPRNNDWLLLFGLATSAVFGSALGYLAGVLVGGVFLVADVLRQRYGRDVDENANGAKLVDVGHTQHVGASPWAN